MRARATALKVRWRFCEHGMLRKIAPWDQRFQCSAPLASFLLSSIFSASSRPLCDQDRSLSRRRDPVALTRGRKRLLGEVRSSSRERPCSSRSCGITGPRPCQGGGSAQRDAERGGAALDSDLPRGRYLGEPNRWPGFGSNQLPLETEVLLACIASSWARALNRAKSCRPHQFDLCPGWCLNFR
jgi:hypothetical protein